jgi:hypothetical protein
MRVLLVSVLYRVPGCISHLFGNPAILSFRTRGFASPDCSGFARSENVIFVAYIEVESYLPNIQGKSNNFFWLKYIFFLFN